MWYKGNKQRCEDYNAIVSYGEAYEGIANKNAIKGLIKADKIKGTTDSWNVISERAGDYYILKHPDYEGTYLTEVAELPTPEIIYL